jgi:uncharacterized protein (DUF362 family)
VGDEAAFLWFLRFIPMMSTKLLTDSSVYLAREGRDLLPYGASVIGTSYSGHGLQSVASPYSDDMAMSLLMRLFEEAGWDSGHVHTVSWNPLGELIQPGDAVVLKPNWVFHANRSGQGMDCLVTHASVLGAMLDLVWRARPGRIVVGDAPIQGCQMPKLMEVARYSALEQHYAQIGAPVEWRDFRRTVLANAEGVWDRQTGLRPLEDYVLFDLGVESLLEPIAQDADRFRVTMYNPDLMRQTHAPGRHQYLVAREIVDADVVVNLPKLKTHKKTCITGALKNLVGINGNKDYLPHHRRGGSRTGGDCYAGGNLFKWAAESLSDAANRREGMRAYLLRQISRGSQGLALLSGADKDLEGSWYGNDTIWRTCLDLNRILLYGKLDGTMAEQPQRKVLTLTDAITCGEGEGPLTPTPHPLGMLTLASNPVAADYVHAHLMGFNWREIPLIREAFGQFRYPICNFRHEDVDVQFEGRQFHQPWPLWNERTFAPPAGWKGHCER